MPQARYRLVDTATTPYYHCMSRCVRRAFLCGQDRYTGKCFDHRKQWILDQVKLLSSLFSIEVCAYAIMSNHFHLVLHVDVERAAGWSTDEVIDRWLGLYKGPEVAQKYKAGETLNQLELEALSVCVGVWRDRLANLSWYMRCLNETIARMANAEDECTGRFWEGRFKSQALLDEAALVSCMAYVDLNPVRAGICESLEASEFTSIQERLCAFRKTPAEQSTSLWLKPMGKESESRSSFTLPIEAASYFELVDWTGRSIRADKKGVIPGHILPVLSSLGVDPENWVSNTQYFGSRFHRALGRINQIRRFAKRSGQRWIVGAAPTANFYS